MHIAMRVDIRRFAQTELITRFNTGLDGNSTVFYTDSNGLQVGEESFLEHCNECTTNVKNLNKYALELVAIFAAPSMIHS